VTSVEQAGRSRRCAVIYNPTKVSEKFRALMEDNLHRGGWGDTLWLETSVEDPGRAMTRQAVAAEVDPLIGASAAPHTHDGGRSVRFRTSFPTRRPGGRGSVSADRGVAVRKPLPRRAEVGRGAPSSSAGNLRAIKMACTSPIVGRLAGSADSIASTKSAS
jgi:hypothetical protein